MFFFLLRFLRGEMSNSRDMHRNALGRGDATPSTPGTNRIHPPSYQRMGSTDSRGSDKDNSSANKGSDWLLDPSVSPSRHTNARSPNINRILNQHSGSGVSPAPRQRKTSEPPTKNASPLYYNKPPLPPKSSREARCSSVDRILDSPAKQKTTQIGPRLVDTEGCSRRVQSPTGRKARSVDDLLDDEIQTTQMTRNDNNNNNSKETTSSAPEPPERSKSSSPFVEKCCETETITVQNTPKIDNENDDNDDQCDTNSNNATDSEKSRKGREGSVLSTDSNISTTSDRTTSSDKRNNKKFFDKYVSKVKNYLKKWQKQNETTCHTCSL